ncbi:hypothetical protein OJ967_27845 (plasmid) [Peribacillus frigoritolerans]|uniref:hypothetical protein n=1 Tax=Peribacillus frigoritolerans TaxID=450367 RepID=UPI002225E8D7|nr:hypothetical protein [Peribacillus frigoritolerans]UYZ01846.1 hypothetical protein OJ967_27845 [Peribacillus frigoritolerans]
MFIDNAFGIWLPSIIFNRIRPNDTNQTTDTDFQTCLYHILVDLSLNNNYVYELRYCMFINTNDSSKQVITELEAPDNGLKSYFYDYDRDYVKLTDQQRARELDYNFHGYCVFHIDLIDFNIRKDLDSYCQSLYPIFINCIFVHNIDTKTHDIDFRKSTFLGINRIPR